MGIGGLTNTPLSKEKKSSQRVNRIITRERARVMDAKDLTHVVAHIASTPKAHNLRSSRYARIFAPVSKSGT